LGTASGSIHEGPGIPVAAEKLPVWTEPTGSIRQEAHGVSCIALWIDLQVDVGVLNTGVCFRQPRIIQPCPSHEFHQLFLSVLGKRSVHNRLLADPVHCEAEGAMMTSLFTNIQ
jgi:hypothetical protein